MGNLFGRKKQSRITEQDKAILQLKQQRDKLKQYQKRITQQLEREREFARQLLRDGKKERAKLLLKKKRYQEQLLDKTENQITNLETMVQNIEFTQIEMKVIEGLKFGNECLNKMHQVMSIEEVERIMDETRDAVEYQKQIDDLLAGSFTQEDEDAILEELEAITQEQVELPEVPSEPPSEKIPAHLPAGCDVCSSEKMVNLNLLKTAPSWIRYHLKVPYALTVFMDDYGGIKLAPNAMLTLQTWSLLQVAISTT
ncbi:charged multivesicular body protein 6 isoform X1 [Notamacropus eugenii]|uniref:charged multivesicular body protein 6 isoform X1 n=1 Tax=Notamacropus eugenii TaxID=9315 RepID=UPI003B67A398